MNRRNKILIISSGTTKHIKRFLFNLSEAANEDIDFDFYAFSIYDKEDSADLIANKVYCTQTNSLMNKLIKLPKIGVIFSIISQCSTLASILKKEQYDLINIHQLPFYALFFVNIAKRRGVKTMLTPWGSDVLRTPKRFKYLLKKVFNKAEYFSTDKKNRFIQDVRSAYSVKVEKFIDLGYGSDVISLIPKFKDDYMKKNMAEKLGVKKADYYITCGYNATRGQRHSTILKALAENKDKLPENYLIIIPLTYGLAKKELSIELKEISDKENLNVSLLTDYLATEQVAYLRIITDLFIHIQSTDNFNASLQETLLGGAQCINGAWLKYPSLEKGGEPYHLLKNIDELPSLMGDIFDGKVKSKKLSCDAEKNIMNNSWNNKIVKWIEFYKQL